MEEIEKMKQKVYEICKHNSTHTNLGCLFLDFDGVINTFALEGSERYQEALHHPNTFDFCDRHCVEELNQFCLEHAIHIVISSSWRFSGIDFCKKYLHEYGLDTTICIKDTTQMDWHSSREEEILQYMLQHPIYAYYLILDDMQMPHLQQYLVQTDVYRGFDEERKVYAQAMLVKNFPWIQNGNLV